MVPVRCTYQLRLAIGLSQYTQSRKPIVNMAKSVAARYLDASMLPGVNIELHVMSNNSRWLQLSPTCKHQQAVSKVYIEL